MAPEVYGALPYGTKVDVFSFAIVVAELLIGYAPVKIKRGIYIML